MPAMDPLVLSRLVPFWRDELVGATFAGVRPRADGLALAPGVPYVAPAAPVPRAVAEFVPGAELAQLARDFPGLPKGLLEALAPTLPRSWTAETLAAWADETYGETPPVRAYAWTWPSPGATLLTRALTLEPGGPGFG